MFIFLVHIVKVMYAKSNIENREFQEKLTMFNG